jgi:hypothetical protein
MDAWERDCLSHQMLRCEFRCAKQYARHCRTISRFSMTNTIIDLIIFLNHRNSYFFVPLHDGWRFTKVNNQPPSATELLWVPPVMAYYN